MRRELRSCRLHFLHVYLWPRPRPRPPSNVFQMHLCTSLSVIRYGIFFSLLLLCQSHLHSLSVLLKMCVCLCARYFFLLLLNPDSYGSLPYSSIRSSLYTWIGLGLGLFHGNIKCSLWIMCASRCIKYGEEMQWKSATKLKRRQRTVNINDVRLFFFFVFVVVVGSFDFCFRWETAQNWLGSDECDATCISIFHCRLWLTMTFV